MLSHENPDRLVIEACKGAQSWSIDACARATLNKRDIRFSCLQKMDVFDRTGSWTYGYVDAFACEQRLIAQPEEKIRPAFLPGREDKLTRRSGLNEVVGNNQSQQRQESCRPEDPRPLTPGAS